MKQISTIVWKDLIFSFDIENFHPRSIAKDLVERNSKQKGALRLIRQLARR